MAWQDREKEHKNLLLVQRHLGEVSMIWAAIDRKLDMLIADILDIGHAETAAIVTGILPTRKAEMLKRLIVISCPGGDWFERMITLLSEISGSFGKERNRLIHDSWRFDIDSITRIDARAKPEQVPFKGKVLAFDKRISVTIEELKKWSAKGHTILWDIDELHPALLPWLLDKRAELSCSQDTQ